MCAILLGTGKIKKRTILFEKQKTPAFQPFLLFLLFSMGSKTAYINPS